MHPDGAAHGSGCTHSSSLAALLALGHPLREAAVLARRLAGDAIGRGLRDVGEGPGPVDAIGIGARSGEGPSAPESAPAMRPMA
jgi:hydroxymethylpyrimidine/phosphomethylpyrimidine kinase